MKLSGTWVLVRVSEAPRHSWNRSPFQSHKKTRVSDAQRLTDDVQKQDYRGGCSGGYLGGRSQCHSAPLRRTGVLGNSEAFLSTARRLQQVQLGVVRS